MLLEVAVIHQEVGVRLYQTVEAIHLQVQAIHLEVAATPCRQRSQVAVESEVHLYCRVKQDMMSALCQTLLI